MEKQVKVEEWLVEGEKRQVYGKLYMPAQAGRYPAIILSHGYNGSHRDWEKECQYYASHGYVAYAYDFCGGSVNAKGSGVSTDMTILTEKEDLQTVFDAVRALEQVQKDKVFLMGGSQGGFVTTLVTEENQDTVAGMILYYPALCIPENWQEKYASREEIPETIDFWGMTLGRGFVESIYDMDVFEMIGNYPKDVLIIQGDRDDIVAMSYAEKASKLYKNAKLEVLVGEGHGFSPEGKETAMKQVLAFMEQHK